jgi:hypothetical protein
MSLKRLSLMIVAVLALTAVVATSANAAVSTTAAQWFKNGTALTETGVAIQGEATEDFVFISEIGSTRIELRAMKISCSGCTIFNKAITSKAGAVATGSGKIVFEEVTVLKPSGCTVTGETGIAGVVATKTLSIHGDWMDTNTENKKAFIQFLPPAESTTFAQFELSGGECAGISGKRNVSGSVFGESVNNTGVEAAEQEIVFSPAVQTTSGAGLLLGTKPASLTGKAKFKLTAGGKYKIQ